MNIKLNNGWWICMFGSLESVWVKMGGKKQFNKFKIFFRNRNL